jgi:FAD/FMN-containing dehydrogenase
VIRRDHEARAGAELRALQGSIAGEVVLPDDARYRFTAGRVAGQARELDLSPWGGAYGRVPPGATAFVHRGDRFLLKQTATVAASAADGERDAARRWLAASTDIVRPAASGRSYQNFPDPELPDPAAAYHGGNVPRLRRIKQRYDPERLFRRGTAL